MTTANKVDLRKVCRIPKDAKVGDVLICRDGKRRAIRLIEKGDTLPYLAENFWFTQSGRAPGASQSSECIQFIRAKPTPKPRKVCRIPLDCVAGDKIQLRDGSVWTRTSDAVWWADPSRKSMEFASLKGEHSQFLASGKHLQDSYPHCVKFIRAKPAKKAVREARTWTRYALASTENDHITLFTSKRAVDKHMPPSKRKSCRFVRVLVTEIIK